MINLFISFAFLVCAYLAGSLPFSIWVTRFLKNVDVRDSGSGHATTTNTIRQDLLKGFIPTWLAYHYAPYQWITPFVAAFAVAGHCWPIFANFRGGMGLATSGAAILAINPIFGLIGLGLLIILVLIIRHSAKAAVVVGVLLSPFYYLLGARGILIGLSAAVGIVIALRFTIDWNRKYRELWLDRELENKM
ncbi:MAG: glycerol-3-phosphate acyltransferase [Anaerolineales bacterium]